MPKSPFQTYQEYVKKSPRNSFDESWRNYLTLRFGYLTPCFVQDVTTGDSMSLETAFALNFMPTVFPLQTPIRVTVHFFYVRYRNLWKNWEDFRWNNKTPVHPYISNSNPDFYKTGSLADYLGVPSTVASGSDIWLSHPIMNARTFRRRPFVYAGANSSNVSFPAEIGNNFDAPLVVSQTLGTQGQIGVRGVDRATAFVFADSETKSGVKTPVTEGYFRLVGEHGFVGYPAGDLYPGIARASLGCIVDEPQFVPLAPNEEFTFRVWTSGDFVTGVADVKVSVWFFEPSALFGGQDAFEVCICNTASYDSTTHLTTIRMEEGFVDRWNLACSEHPGFVFAIVFHNKSSWNDNTDFFVGAVNFLHRAAEPVDISSLGNYNPFMHSETDGIRLNALPFRAYEQIYNSYYRNERVEPFMKNGEAQYNDFLTTDDDGADSTDYHLFKRNWEYDFLTSALPSPQQGTAPIVGVDIRNITFQDGDRLVHYRYNTEADGETLAPGGHFEETDVSNNVRQTAVDLISNGFTINAFRDANAMQIFLEKNIRRGLRYKDQHMSHTGVELDYAELDLPEFIGGVSQYVKAEQITNMAAGSAPLGDYAGQLSAFGEIKHKINHFFREDGMVMGIMCVTPQPAYSQLLPKHFLRTSALDYFNSEFTHLGMQPIPLAEVAPLQAYAAMQAGREITLNTTFGYQRPNYDMVARVDEVHGQMRTTMRNFIMNRTFTDVPELGAEFLHVDPAQLNQVFQFTNEGEDTIFGQIAFKCFMKRPVPRVGEPRLEA